MEELLMEIMESTHRGDITLDTQQELLEVVTESSRKSLKEVKKLKDDVKKIKNSAPNKYVSGAEDIKKFIDTNYDKIMQAISTLEKEHDDMDDFSFDVDAMIDLALTATTVISGMALTGLAAAEAPVVAMISVSMITLLSLIALIVRGIRVAINHGRIIVMGNDLVRLKKELSNIDIDKLPKNCRGKMAQILSGLDSAEDSMKAIQDRENANKISSAITTAGSTVAASRSTVVYNSAGFLESSDWMLEDTDVDVFTEAFINPLKKFKDKLTAMKKKREEQKANNEEDKYSEHLKKFIDKDYDNVMAAIEILEMDQSRRDAQEAERNKKDCNKVVAVYTTLVAYIATIAISHDVAALVALGVIILGAAIFLRWIIRMAVLLGDKLLMKALSHNKEQLKKIDQSELSPVHQHKIRNMIVTIDKAENKFGKKSKVVREYVNPQLLDELKGVIHDITESGGFNNFQEDELLVAIGEKYI